MTNEVASDPRYRNHLYGKLEKCLKPELGERNIGILYEQSQHLKPCMTNRCQHEIYIKKGYSEILPSQPSTSPLLRRPMGIKLMLLSYPQLQK